MEIDLNDDAQEEGEGEGSGKQSKREDGDGMYMELWHACAGPHISLPKKGSLVVYFPQGHLEQAQVASSASCCHPHHSLRLSTHALPPQVFCRVVDVHLLAEKENDEVYARLTLSPITEVMELNLEDNEKEGDETGGMELPRRSTPHMFCKTLTASDTSTHGGFSVPRRAAEDCFPPLDYMQQRPSQELISKDLHGVEWRFRHIYRGQPRRHLLTTGWSVFVNQKNLVSGDAVLFMRGANGELRLGIRRATRPHAGVSSSPIGGLNMHLSVLSSAADAISKKNMFYILYNPRPSCAKFVVSYQKFIKSINRPLSVGMRFKVKYGMEDTTERRFNGVITGIGDLDPVRWAHSKWRCLMVRWDESIVTSHTERISPWDIDSLVSAPALGTLTGPRLKKNRADIMHQTHAPPSAGGIDHSGESVRSSKVLHGKINVNFGSPYDGGGGRLLHRQEFNMHSPVYRGLGLSMAGRSVGFEESVRFQKVLQGQEISLYNGLKDMARRPSPLFPPLSEDSSNSYVPITQQKVPSYEITSPTLSAAFNYSTKILKENEREEIHAKDAQGDGNSGCKLFSIPEDDALQNSPSASNKRSCTKVHKQGHPVGRAIDLSKLDGYGDLLVELERLFNMEGLLSNPDNGWQVVYTDKEDDMMLVGDDPWLEFCNIVSKIHIYTQEEVERMATVLNNDDAQSCLEEAPAVIDTSKSSSPRPRESSPTVTKTGIA